MARACYLHKRQWAPRCQFVAEFWRAQRTGDSTGARGEATDYQRTHTDTATELKIEHRAPIDSSSAAEFRAEIMIEPHPRGLRVSAARSHKIQ